MTTTSASFGRDGLDSICMSGALIRGNSGGLPYRSRGNAAGTPQTFVIGRNFLRFAAFDAGYYCGNGSLAPHRVETDAHSWQSDQPTIERGACIRARVGRPGGAD